MNASQQQPDAATTSLTVFNLPLSTTPTSLWSSYLTTLYGDPSHAV